MHYSLFYRLFDKLGCIAAPLLADMKSDNNGQRIAESATSLVQAVARTTPDGKLHFAKIRIF